MQRYKLVLMLFMVIILSPQLVYANETNDYRPEYSFSKDIFQNLPPFPYDFFEVKELFLTQQVMVSQLNESYYLQPEILTSWDFCAEYYYNTSNPSVGKYGLGFLPARFDIFNHYPGAVITISAIAYATPGIPVYQGLKLEVNESSHTNTTIITPTSKHILFGPTYPHFSSSWAQIVELNIKVYNKTDAVVELFERLPDEYYENLWESEHDSYVSGNSLATLSIPRLKVVFHDEVEQDTDEIDEAIKKNSENENYLYFIILLIIIIISVIAIKSYIGKIYGKEKKQKD